ncbi:MAG: hypothetical protein U9R50_02420 [Campylobacterota bacterium]|nr:hypothetical protein [Campylobacterota bacterium]
MKNHFINAFREVFLYHHNSLEFRAKLFAVIIAANASAGECEYKAVRDAGMIIYDDETRADSLEYTVREYVDKVLDKNGLDSDMLIEEILRDLKDIPRYSKKINTALLHNLIECHSDEETAIYQERIIELFESLRDESQNEKK